MHHSKMALDLANRKVAVLMGGPGSERKVSLKSAEGVIGEIGRASCRERV